MIFNYKGVIVLKKINILKKNEDFGRIINSTKALKSKNFTIFIEKTNNDVYHFGISVGTKIGKAVIRNKIKRQIKNIIDKKDYKNNFNCIIIVKRGILNLSFLEMQQELYNQFDKLNIIKEK